MESLSSLLPYAALVPAVAATLAFKREGASAIKIVIRAAWATFLLLTVLALHAATSGVPADAIGVVLALLTSFVGAIVLSFSRRHMKADARLPLFAGRVGLLVAAVLFFVTATNLVSLALAWIASGWLLASLIGHVPNWAEAAAAAARARRHFLLGDVALLVALLVLGLNAGAASISAAVAEAGELAPAEQLLIAGLLLIAALARCSVPPFHDWLMRSMAAPTPVSALMHAGLVNAGGFLLIRFAPVVEAAPAVKLAAICLGAVGALFGIGVMMVRPDVKRALGGSTVAQMSFMIMTCGLGFYAAALWHLVAHGLFKAWLFLGAGSNIGRAPTKASLEPFTPAAAVMVAGLAIAILIAWSTAQFPAPGVLALATALSGAGAALRTAQGRSGPILLASAGLSLSYLGGVTTFSMLPGIAQGGTVLPVPGEAALALVFFAVWVWQAARRPLPTPLYIRFLNSGGPALIR